MPSLVLYNVRPGPAEHDRDDKRRTYDRGPRPEQEQCGTGLQEPNEDPEPHRITPVTERDRPAARIRQLVPRLRGEHEYQEQTRNPDRGESGGRLDASVHA